MKSYLFLNGFRQIICCETSISQNRNNKTCSNPRVITLTKHSQFIPNKFNIKQINVNPFLFRNWFPSRDI